MKKSLLLFAAALVAGGASAQDVENLAVKVENGWNVSPVASGAAISFTSDYGEFKLIPSSITKTAYKGFRVEFSDLVNAEGSDGVHLKIGKVNNVKNEETGKEEDKGVYSYPSFAAATDGVLEGEFAEDLVDEIAVINVQCNKAGESIKINKFSLIKADGTEEVRTTLGGVAWGCSAEQDVNGLTFAGQYGAGVIKTADGKSVTYDPEAEKNVVYTYNIELAEPAPGKVTLELNALGADGSEGGFSWHNIEKGSSSITFEVSAEKCAKAVSNIYIKGGDDDKTLYPFTVIFKSVTRTKVVNRDKTPDPTKNQYKLNLKNGQVILASDLEKYNDGDIVVFNYSCDWVDASVSFDGWGIGGLRNPEAKEENVVTLNAGKEKGDYTYVTFIDELKKIVGHHAAEPEGENADTEEWDGLYWFTWGTKNGDCELTTTKGNVVVYTDVKTSLPEVKLPADASVVSSQYISLTGKVAAAPHRGVNVVKQTLSDGSVRFVKTVVK